MLWDATERVAGPTNSTKKYWGKCIASCNNTWGKNAMREEKGVEIVIKGVEIVIKVINRREFDPEGPRPIPQDGFYIWVTQ